MLYQKDFILLTYQRIVINQIKTNHDERNHTKRNFYIFQEFRKKQ